MPILKLDYNTKELRRLGRIMRQVERVGGDTETMFADMGEYTLQVLEDRFYHQVDPEGRPWTPLQESSRARKRNAKILTESGRLRRSYIYRASTGQLLVGSNVIYAAIHQFGGKTKPHTIRPRNKKALFWAGASHPMKAVNHPGSVIPARPVLGISREDRKEYIAIAHDHYRAALRG